MKICKNCGGENKDHNMFCWRCSTGLSNAEIVSGEAVQQKEYEGEWWMYVIVASFPPIGIILGLYEILQPEHHYHLGAILIGTSIISSFVTIGLIALQMMIGLA